MALPSTNLLNPLGTAWIKAAWIKEVIVKNQPELSFCKSTFKSLSCTISANSISDVTCYWCEWTKPSRDSGTRKVTSGQVATNFLLKIATIPLCTWPTMPFSSIAKIMENMKIKTSSATILSKSISMLIIIHQGMAKESMIWKNTSSPNWEVCVLTRSRHAISQLESGGIDCRLLSYLGWISWSMNSSTLGWSRSTQIHACKQRVEFCRKWSFHYWTTYSSWQWTVSFRPHWTGRIQTSTCSLKIATITFSNLSMTRRLKARVHKRCKTARTYRCIWLERSMRTMKCMKTKSEKRETVVDMVVYCLNLNKICCELYQLSLIIDCMIKVD